MVITVPSVSIVAEVLDGLKSYFDFLLPDQLLYSQERPQFKQLVEESAIGRATLVSRIPHCLPAGQPPSSKAHSNHVNHSLTTHAPPPILPSDVYGIEHLLRLFVRLPLLLSKAQLPLTHLTLLHTHLREFLE